MHERVRTDVTRCLVGISNRRNDARQLETVEKVEG